MAGTAERVLALVTSAPQPGRAAFAQHLHACVQQHGDIASEATWQEFSRVIVQHWGTLSQDQDSSSTWAMLSKCTDVILKIRRVAKQGRGADGEAAIEEFRAFIREITGDQGA